jgi:predicted NUDIX family NTP pyrophosphohydrolase
MATPKTQSAGLLMYRWRQNVLEVFLVHPGGPFWAKKDLGAWSIPKGTCIDGEDPLHAAQREFTEETGFSAEGPFMNLETVTQSGGKQVSAWAFAGDHDPADLRSNTCAIIWPPRSQKTIEIPEVDRGEWFSIPEARRHILPAQSPFLDRLCEKLNEAE